VTTWNSTEPSSRRCATRSSTSCGTRSTTDRDPEEREVAGKEPTGHVRLTAERERDHVIIEVADDGGGSIPTSSARRRSTGGVKSREAVEAMENEEVYDLVFHPGFSTAEEVTDVSGRGVGMDVVRTTARDLDGSVSVESEPGEGTTVQFRLPVTVAIVKVMFVDVGGTEYGIPIKSIAEVARADDVEEVHGDGSSATRTISTP